MGGHDYVTKKEPKLEHKPKTILLDGYGLDKGTNFTNYYSAHVTCDNCDAVFKVWILKGKPRNECKRILCPICQCETTV